MAQLAGVALLLFGVGAVIADEPEPLYVLARAAIKDGRIEKSGLRGADDARRRFTELPAEGGVLIGFDLGVGKFTDIETVYALRSVYLTARGEVAYHDHGLFADERIAGSKRVNKTKVLRTVSLRARPGFAVGGATIRSGLNINGLSLTYMEIKGRTLDAAQSYESEWVGDRTGGSEGSLSAKGAPVVGIYGSQDENHVISLGLISITQPASAKKPPSDLPKDGKTVKPSTNPKIGQPADTPKNEAKSDGPAPVNPVSDSSKEDAASPKWVPYVVLAGVAVGVFVVLLVLTKLGKASGKKIGKPVPPPARPPDQEGITAKPPETENPLGTANAPVPVWAEKNPYVRSDAVSKTQAEPINPFKREDAHNPAWYNEFRSADEEIPARSARFSKARNEVAGTLFGIAVLQFVCGVAATALIPEMEAALGLIVCIAVVYVGLAFLAWVQPFPAALIGLVIYIVMFVVELMIVVQSNNNSMMSGMFVRIAIIGALVKALSTAANANSR